MDSISSTLHEEVKKGMVTLLLPVMNKVVFPLTAI